MDAGAAAPPPARMKYLAGTAHWQFLGLIAGCLGWILLTATAGINEWRLWLVDDLSVITSGVAWVGIWRACFYSHTLPDMENCWSMGVTDSFVPAEILVAQVLMVLAILCGLAGNISGSLAMRLAYFSVDDRRNIRLLFLLAGCLYVLTGTLTVVPLAWNMSSVLSNSTIDFPPEFHLPPAPLSQQVGTGIGMGFLASLLMFFSGSLFLCYRYVWETLRPEPLRTPNAGWTEPPGATLGNSNGIDNPSFLNDCRT